MVTFEDILNAVKEDKNFDSNDFDSKILNWTARGCKELSLSGVAISIATTLPVTMLKTVDLPPDYESWVKIGRMCGENVISLTNMEKLAKTLNIDDCGHEYRTIASCCEEDNHVYRSKYGSFKLDDKHHRIILDARYDADHIYLEYISKGYSSTTGETIIPNYAELALIEFVHLKFAENMPIYQKEYQMRFQNYEAQKRRAIREKYKLSMADINRIISKNRKMIKSVY